MTEAETIADGSTVPADEFDPVGTLALIVTYFVLLIAFWIFIYFVEFLGNELVVIG